jgi:hypothetical protein
MNHQNLLFSQSTSTSITLNQNQCINKEEEFNYLDDLPDEEEEGLTEHAFNISSQIEFNEERREGENALANLDKKKRFKVIKQLKRRLDKATKRFFLKSKTFKVKKSFCRMNEKDFYDKYILKDLSVKKTFAGFSKANLRIFRKLSRKVNCAEFEQFISTKIRTFFRPAANGQE